MGIRKTQNFMLISNSLMPTLKNDLKNSYGKKLCERPVFYFRFYS
jgi:hypothetical protein